MTEIITFDKTNLRAMRVELDAALAAIGAKYGVSVHLGNCRFTSDSASWKFDTKTKTTGSASTGITVEMANAARLYGLDLDRVAPDGSKLVEYRKRQYKYPWIVRRNGKLYKNTTATAVRNFGKTEEIRAGWMTHTPRRPVKSNYR